MNVDERIAKLEALLARVRSRAHAPKGLNGTSHASPTITDVIAAPPSAAHFPPPPASGTRLQTLPPPEPEPPPSFLPPQPRHTPRPAAPALGATDDASIDRTLADAIALAPPRAPEPSHVRTLEAPPLEVIELDIDPDPSVAPPPLPQEDQLESRSRLVSAPPAQLPEDHEAREEKEEPAPSSSRRAISLEEKLHSLAEEGEIAGHHTPPPESGRLPAAPIALDVDQESTGVRRADAEDVAAFEGSFDVAPTPETFGQLIALTLELGE